MTRLDREIEAGAERASSLKILRWVTATFGATAAPCPYPAHRHTDWRRADRDDAPTVCGICHPPAVPAEPAHA